MESLQDTQLFSSKMGLVPPMSTVRLAMLLINTLKVNSYIGNICKRKSFSNHHNYVHHGMQVYKNTHGIMQGSLHQLNTEEVYCLTGLTFRPRRIVSALYAAFGDTNNVLAMERKLSRLLMRYILLQFLDLWKMSLLASGRVLTLLLLLSPGNHQRNRMV